MKRRRRLGIVGVLLGVLILGAGCGSSTPDQDSFTLRLHEVTHSPFYAPQYVALTQGYFEEEGLKVDLVDGKGGDKVTTALLSGEADVILVGAEMTIYVNEQNPADPMVIFARLTKRDGSFLVARRPMDPFRWQDLRGLQYLAQRKGGMPDMIGRHVLKKHGLEPGKDLEYLQHVDYANLGPAFISGVGDVVQIFEPYASTIEKEGKGYVVAALGPESGDVLYTSYHTRKSFLDAHRDVLIRFTRAIYRGQQFVLTHSPEEIAKAIAPQFEGVDLDTLTRIVTRLKDADVFSHDPLPPREDYEQTITILMDNSMLKDRFPYEKAVDPSIAEEAMATSP